jgi:hypothetical protein
MGSIFNTIVAMGIEEGPVPFLNDRKGDSASVM